MVRTPELAEMVRSWGESRVGAGLLLLLGTDLCTVIAAEPHVGPVPLSALGKCLEKIHSRMSGGGSHSSEESRRAGLGVKRTHSEDASSSSAVLRGVKRPTLEMSAPSRLVSSCSPSHRDLWRPPEELPGTPSKGKCQP
ncbi:unnamed protein product [Ranitomeya imitator]|uniref:Uncharacterized protein n=1 Tax=Ranitomeya imitator TaxID=111125 RepID=A0ABN9LP65_9NEOB|nr:unnamed protein product [Ranitomeya imitator]